MTSSSDLATIEGIPTRSYGAELAANIRAERARRDLSQRSLAARMKALGWPWTHSLVAKLEAGNRPLLAAELLGLALALDVSLPTLMGVSEDAHLVELPGGITIGSATVQCLAWGSGGGPWVGEEWRRQDGR